MNRSEKIAEGRAKFGYCVIENFNLTLLESTTMSPGVQNHRFVFFFFLTSYSAGLLPSMAAES